MQETQTRLNAPAQRAQQPLVFSKTKLSLRTWFSTARLPAPVTCPDTTEDVIPWIHPTLVLSPDTIQNALNIFTKGVFKDQRQWTQVIKEFLCVPAEQHDLLNLDIQNEDLLNKFKKEQRFQSLFKYGSEIAKTSSSESEAALFFDGKSQR